MSRSFLRFACAALLLAAPIAVAACGGTSAGDSKEPSPTGGGIGSETAAASAEASVAASATAVAEAPFMRVGDVTAAPIAPVEPPPPPPDLDPKQKQKDKKSFSAGAPPNPSPTATAAARQERKAEDEGGSGGEPKKPPPPGAAVVDSSNNLSEAEVRATIVQKQSSFRECYDIGLKAGPTFSGTVQLRVSIGPSGSVASADVLSSTTKVVQVDSCVLQAVKRIQFPAKGNGAVVAFPIEFGG